MASASSFATVRKIFGWFVLVVLVATLVLILKQSPAPEVATSSAAAQSAERKLDTAAEAAQSGQAAQVQLDSSELDSYLAQNLQLAGNKPSDAAADPTAASKNEQVASTASAPATGVDDPQTVEQAASTVESVKIDMDGDLVKTYIVFNFHGKDLSLQIDGHLYSQGGYLKFDPVGGKIGSFPLPQSALQAAVERMTTSPENREKLRLPDNISNIEVQNSEMVISYK
jgi:hypothetical protein